MAVLCISCAVIYAGILGDAFTPLFASAGLPPYLNYRWSNIVLVSACVLLPMSLVRDLSSLAYTSFLGFASIVYTVAFISVRSFDGSYRVGSGKFVLTPSDEAFEEDVNREILETTTATNGLLVVPEFEHDTWWHADRSSLVLVSNLGLFFLAHYNAPAFYRELKDASADRFQVVVAWSYAVLIALYGATMMAGYWTFGDVVRGNILLNYHPDDGLATFGRVATAMSILFGFPLVVCGAREGLHSLSSDWNRQPQPRQEQRHQRGCSANNRKIIVVDTNDLDDDAVGEEGRFLNEDCDNSDDDDNSDEDDITCSSHQEDDGDGDCKRYALAIGIVSFSAAAAICVTDISLIMGLTGASIGSFLAYVCPALIYSRAVALDKGQDSQEHRLAKMNLVLIPFGVVLGALGVYMTVQKEIAKRNEAAAAAGGDVAAAAMSEELNLRHLLVEQLTNA